MKNFFKGAKMMFEAEAEKAMYYALLNVNNGFKF